MEDLRGPDDDGAHSASAPPAVDPKETTRATALGAFAGFVGAIAMLVVASWLARASIAVAIGRLLAPAMGAEGAMVNGVAISACVGVIGGALLGRITRHVRRVLATAIFGAVFFPAVWMAIGTLVLPRFAPHVAAALPVLPMMAGMGAYGVVVATAAWVRGA